MRVDFATQLVISAFRSIITIAELGLLRSFRALVFKLHTLQAQFKVLGDQTDGFSPSLHQKRFKESVAPSTTVLSLRAGVWTQYTARVSSALV